MKPQPGEDRVRAQMSLWASAEKRAVVDGPLHADEVAEAEDVQGAAVDVALFGGLSATEMHAVLQL